MKNSKFIPSIFTILNLFCGFTSLIFASKENLEGASIFIICAATFDAIDGLVSRITKSSSKFGVELDSLSDIISFGVAPSFLLYKFYFYKLDVAGIAIAGLILMFSALRLARFNTQLIGFDKIYFTGLPTPIAGLTVASFFLHYFNKNFAEPVSEILIYLIALSLPLLMISKLRYDTLPGLSRKDIKAHPVRFILSILILMLIVFTLGEGIFAFCLFYITTGLYRGFKKLLKKSKVEEETKKEISKISL